MNNYKSILRVILFLPILLLMGATPNTGDFVTRAASVWSIDKLSNILNDITIEACFIGKLNIEENVEKGPYRAKVNWSACTPGSVPSSSDWFEIVTVNVVKSAIDKGYIAYIWNSSGEQDGVITQYPETYYYKYTLINGPNISNINGNFKMEICSSSQFNAGDCMVKSFRKAVGQNLESHKVQNLGNGFGGYLHAFSSVSDNNGYGAIVAHKYVNGAGTPTCFGGFDLDLTYGYSGGDLATNVVTYVSGDPNVTPRITVLPPGSGCLDRTTANALMNVFNYEIYNADGSLYKINNPQFPYRIVDSQGQYVKDQAGNTINGRIMWDDASNTMGWFLTVPQADVRALLNAGKVLFAESWLAKASTYKLNIAPDPNNAQGFIIVKSDGTQYMEDPALRLKLKIISGVTVKGLLDLGLEGTDQIISYMGNGYIHHIPWDSGNSFHYSIMNGAQAVGVDDGKTYFIRPMFYSINMPSKSSCNTLALAQLPLGLAKRQLIPANTLLTDSPSPEWLDPRSSMGPVPGLGSGYKYIDGILQ